MDHGTVTYLGERPWLLFAVAVALTAGYVLALDLLPAGLKSVLRTMPFLWLLPGAATFLAYLFVWRGDSIPARRRYLHALGYAFWAPIVALTLIGTLFGLYRGALLP